MSIGAAASPLCSYDVDRALNLVSVDEGWTVFALSNDAPHLLPPAPIGQPVISRDADSTTQFIYHELFGRTAATGRPVTFDIRCDSPEMRRYLDLTITPHDDGFTLTTRLVRAEPNPGGQLLASPSMPDTQALVRFCSWCKRIYADHAWWEVDEGLPRLGLFREARVPLITHGMCDACEHRMRALIDSL